jgi:hypothetical protein
MGEEYRYFASRRLTYNSNDNRFTHSKYDTIVLSTTDLLKCIKEIIRRRNKDIQIHNNNEYVYPACENVFRFTISYEIGIYIINSEIGSTEWLDIYYDNYQKNADHKLIQRL